MDNNREVENQQAHDATKSASNREAFFVMHQKRILKLTSKVVHKYISLNDDEWSISMIAVSDALDSYDESKGDFWAYASVIMKNRLIDDQRKQAKRSREILLSSDYFEGEFKVDDTDYTLKLEVQQKTSTLESLSIKDEIDALTKEFNSYGFSFFDLAKSSPKTDKTRNGCFQIVKSIFTPPPLIENIRDKKVLPVKEISRRTHFSTKMIDRHRDYILASLTIMTGDYPGLQEYMSYLKPVFRSKDLQK